MILSAFSVRDRVAGAFLPPFFMTNEAVASRAFRQSLADPNHSFSKNPADYALHEIGSFNDESGELVAIGDPRFIMLGASEDQTNG